MYAEVASDHQIWPFVPAVKEELRMERINQNVLCKVEEELGVKEELRMERTNQKAAFGIVFDLTGIRLRREWVDSALGNVISNS